MIISDLSYLEDVSQASSVVGGVVWKAAANGKIPPNANSYGTEFRNGKNVPLYVCRGPHPQFGGSHPGKVAAGGCYFAYGNKVIIAPSYDVLLG